MIHIALATEDVLSEAVGKRLLAELQQPIQVEPLLRKDGFGYLRSKMSNWCQLAQQQPVVLLTDLDKLACPTAMLDSWYGKLTRPENLVLRIAVREIESWLLADHEAMRKLVGGKGKLPPAPDTLPAPKQQLLKLSQRAKRDIRLDLVKEIGAIASQGVGYNARLTEMVATDWCPERAAQLSPSLRKARLRLQDLGNRLKENID